MYGAGVAVNDFFDKLIKGGVAYNSGACNPNSHISGVQASGQTLVINLTKPAQPNVLIVLTEPQRVRLTAGLHRDVRRVALRLDDGRGFLAALESRRTTLYR